MARLLKTAVRQCCHALWGRLRSRTSPGALLPEARESTALFGPGGDCHGAFPWTPKLSWARTHVELQAATLVDDSGMRGVLDIALKRFSDWRLSATSACREGGVWSFSSSFAAPCFGAPSVSGSQMLEVNRAYTEREEGHASSSWSSFSSPSEKKMLELLMSPGMTVLFHKRAGNLPRTRASILDDELLQQIVDAVLYLAVRLAKPCTSRGGQGKLSPCKRARWTVESLFWRICCVSDLALCAFLPRARIVYAYFQCRT